MAPAAHGEAELLIGPFRSVSPDQGFSVGQQLAQVYGQRPLRRGEGGSR